eukprot:3889009-Amphidinium_carterae.1
MVHSLAFLHMRWQNVWNEKSKRTKTTMVSRGFLLVHARWCKSGFRPAVLYRHLEFWGPSHVNVPFLQDTPKPDNNDS